MAPSAANHPSIEEFASLEDVIPNRTSFLEMANSLTGNPVSEKLACKFAFFLHFLNTMFIVLGPAFPLPSQLCEVGAHCTVYARQEQIAVISILNTM